MKPPILRVLSASGAYLRRRLGALCNTLARQGPAFGASTQLLDGYLLKARKVSGRTTGYLLDMPVVIAIDSGYTDAGGDSYAPITFALPTGRDAVSPTYQALQADFRAAPAFQLPHPAFGYTNGATSSGIEHNVVRGNIARSPTEGVLIHTDAHLQNLATSTLTMAGRLDATCVAQVFFQHPVIGASKLVPAGAADTFEVVERGEVSATGLLHYFRITDNAYTDKKMLTRVEVDGSEAPADLSGLNGGFNAQPPMWVRAAVGPGSLAGGYTYFVATRFTKQADPRDYNGKDVLVVSKIEVERTPEGELALALSTFFTIDMATMAGIMAPAVVVPPDTTYTYTGYNAIFPIGMAYLTDGNLACIVRMINHKVTSGHEYRYPYVMAFRINADTGAIAGGVVDILTPITATDVYDHDYWFLSAVGMAAGEEGEAVYICQNTAIAEEFPEESPTPVYRLGVVRFAPDGITKTTFVNPGFKRYLGVDYTVDTFAPGWEQVNSKFTTSADECSVESVVYMGNSKYLFPVSSTSSVVGGTFDFAVALYDSALNAVSQIAVIETGLRAVAAVTDITPARGVSVGCVSREIADSEGNIVTPAVLLASLGNGRGSTGTFPSHPDTPRGKSWISYDSGATWQQFCDYGSSRGIFYGGSVTVRPQV